MISCILYCSCQPPFGLSEALLARCCYLRRCRAADIVFARHSQFHFSAIAIAEHVRACTRRDAGITRAYPDTVRTQTQLVPRRDLRRPRRNNNRQKSPLNSLDGGSLTLAPIITILTIPYSITDWPAYVYGCNGNRQPLISQTIGSGG